MAQYTEQLEERLNHITFELAALKKENTAKLSGADYGTLSIKVHSELGYCMHVLDELNHTPFFQSLLDPQCQSVYNEKFGDHIPKDVISSISDALRSYDSLKNQDSYVILQQKRASLLELSKDVIYAQIAVVGDTLVTSFA